MQDPAISPFTSFLANEAVSLTRFNDNLDDGTLTRVLAEMCMMEFAWPQRIAFRGLVSKRFSIHVAPDVEERSSDVRPEPGTHECLEIVPEGFPEEAFRIAGAFVAPCERGLEAGSVVHVVLDVDAPRPDDVVERGFLARIVSLEAEVAVER